MSHEFSRISIEHLCSWILEEEAENRIFGIHRDLFFNPKPEHPFRMTRYGMLLESPIGVAAGPHTQMAQNIISAWLCGARYIELKTVQTLDELNVSKPCIDAEDEGYNCEWSQELRLNDTFEEYLNAWIILHLLRNKFGWKGGQGCGFLFNMSVGYNMEGMLKDNVQRFFDRMANCGTEMKAKLAALRGLYPKIDEIEIPECLSDNITLSTMHGCPPDEIEKIGMYLINERNLHTTIKLNPTLLGPTELRYILNDRLGFETRVPDEAFAHDLIYSDAVKLITNLREAAKRKNLHFSLKLTNTLESVNHKSVFPSNEKMMYLSGRPLHPISINVAAKLQNEFNGELDISFSAGLDCFNIPETIACGIKPVTVCSDVLKPGGYGRLSQYLEELETRMAQKNSRSIDEFILAWDGGGHGDTRRAALTTLRHYAGTLPGRREYRKDSKTGLSVKTRRPLTPFDCIKAPCIVTCPANQDIPLYMYHAGIGEYKKAYEVILQTNPFPTVCGMVCDHQCQHKCTRSNYDQSLLIREVKRFIAEKNENRPEPTPAAANGKSVVIIGAGPSGLACAYFLALEGFNVSVYETKAFAGGMISDAIPSFRLTNEAIQKDVAFIQRLGVKIFFDQKIDPIRFAALRKEFDFVYIAVGAQAAKRMGIPGESAKSVLDSLKFLSDVRQGRKVGIGPSVAVIGGGNTAIDVARTAQRLVNSGGKVTLLYRRSRKEMPADAEEVKAMLDEGIELQELTAPVSLLVKEDRAQALICQGMRLGEKGADGRARFEAIPDTEKEVPFDTIIPAIGQDIVLEFIGPKDLKIDPGSGMTQLENVFAGGDVVRGGATIIKAIADGKNAARNILVKASKASKNSSECPDATAERKPRVKFDSGESILKKGLTADQFQQRNARRVKGISLPEVEVEKRQGFETVIRSLTEEEAKTEAMRCLFCNDLCNVCVTVCPNRANFSYCVTSRDFPVFKAVKKHDAYALEKIKTFRLAQNFQVLNIGDFCNECGNCTTFCPTAGAPYKDKPKFYLTEESFAREENGYRLTGISLKAKVEGRLETLTEKNGAFLFHAGPLKAKVNKASLAVESVRVDGKAPPEIILERAVHLGILYNSLSNACFKE